MPEEMQDYKVVLTWEAIYDVTDIADYIEAMFGKERADRFQDDIKNLFLRPLFSMFLWNRQRKFMYSGYCVGNETGNTY